MYLKRIWLENTGPITHLDIEMPFDSQGSPQPIILVGTNGAGKTTVLSYIADALIETAKSEYQDVVPNQGFSSPYFRVVGGNNTKTGSNYSIAVLGFEVKTDSDPLKLVYHEQTGASSPQNWSEHCQEKFGQYISWSDGEKQVIGLNKQIVEEAFQSTSNCYFPSNRHEKPNWYNDTIAIEVDAFDIGRNFQKQIKNKPLIVTESAQKNQSWLLHLFLDSRADFSPYIVDNQINFQPHGNLQDLLQRKVGIENVNTVLRDILKDNTIYLATLPRTQGLERICIAKDQSIFIPSLKNLSAGQSILLNLFLTIIRYADRTDISKTLNLAEIKGIVVIDEIDSHLHSDLQHDILPNLIKRFPKVQFILTSHAPLFILGMDHVFGQEGYMILDMPDGNSITAERFSEFERSFEYYKNTKKFDDEQRENLRKEFEKQAKPLVLTEGDTDVDYIHTALKLMNRSDILDKIDIEWIGSTRQGQQFFTGDRSLNNAAEFLRANPEFLKSRRVLLVYDLDTRKPISIENNLWIYTIPLNTENTKIKKGIENLLPAELFDPEDRRFYSRIQKEGDYGQNNIISEFNKRAFCNYICQERRELPDFSGFETVIEYLNNFANNNQAASV